MKIIAPTNNKGGVGKTKVSVLLAEYLSKVLKKRVLAIDFDPQCNFSQRFLQMEIDPASPEGKIPPIHPDYNPDEEGSDWDGRGSIADIFYSQAGTIPYPTYIDNLDIMPAHASKLLEAETVRKSEVVEKVHKQIGKFLESPDVQSAYDVAVIDTAPSKGPLTVSVIKAASHIVIPSVMEEQPIQGIYGMLQLWMQESFRRQETKPLELIGILPNMFRQINLHKEMLESLRANEAIKKYVMPFELGQRAVFAELDAEGAIPKTVFDLPDSNIAKQEAMKVCHYITERVFADD